MDSRKQLFFLALSCLLDMTCVTASAWEAKLYSQTQQKGSFLHVSGKSSSTCVNINHRNICDSEDNCEPATFASKSINTENTCVRLYTSDDCDGTPLMEISPGTICHSYWERCKLINTVRSIRGCSPVSALSSPIQATQRKMDTEEITSPNYPNDYRNNADLTWINISEPNRRINITFDDFKLENHTSCGYDNLTIIDPINENVLFRGCGEVLPPTIRVNSNQFILRFKTDGSETQKGFALRWASEAVPDRHARAPSPPEAASVEEPDNPFKLSERSFHVAMDFSDVTPAIIQNGVSRLVCHFIE